MAGHCFSFLAEGLAIQMFRNSSESLEIEIAHSCDESVSAHSCDESVSLYGSCAINFFTAISSQHSPSSLLDKILLSNG
jgi:hypothetical protein